MMQDDLVNEFSINKPCALLIITRASCPPCIQYNKMMLPNTQTLFANKGIPLLHVDVDSLSPHMQQLYVPHTPVFLVFSDGKYIATAHVRQDRSPQEMLRFVLSYKP